MAAAPDGRRGGEDRGREDLLGARAHRLAADDTVVHVRRGRELVPRRGSEDGLGLAVDVARVLGLVGGGGLRLRVGGAELEVDEALGDGRRAASGGGGRGEDSSGVKGRRLGTGERLKRLQRLDLLRASDVLQRKLDRGHRGLGVRQQFFGEGGESDPALDGRGEGAFPAVRSEEAVAELVEPGGLLVDGSVLSTGSVVVRGGRGGIGGEAGGCRKVEGVGEDVGPRRLGRRPRRDRVEEVRDGVLWGTERRSQYSCRWAGGR